MTIPHQHKNITRLYPVHIRALISLFQIKTQQCTHVFLTPLNTTSLRNVSALKGPSSGRTTDTFQQQGQQHELTDVKLNNMSYYM